MDLDKMIADLVKLRETMPGDTRIMVCFSTANESWEEPAYSALSVLKWDDGQPDAIGVEASI